MIKIYDLITILSYLFFSCVCAPGEFQCPGDQCLPADRVCDGHRDCPSGIDEAVCPSKGRDNNKISFFMFHTLKQMINLSCHPLCVWQ